MSDKSAYYGGYSLYRGNQPGAQPSNNGTRSVPAFQNDWMLGSAPNTTQRGGVFPLLRNFFAPIPQFGQPAAVPQQGNANGNFYKGAPLTRAGTTGNHAHPAVATAQSVSTGASHNENRNSTKAAVKQNQPNKNRTASKVIRQASGSWGAFDGIAPLNSTARHVDPIGTPAPRSVWAGTPADANTVKSPTTWSAVTPGSLWRPPNLQKWMTGGDSDSDDVDPALLDKATKQSMLGWASEAADDNSIQAMLQALTTEPVLMKPPPASICDVRTKTANGNDSDDEWLDNFQETVDRAMRQPSSDATSLKTKVDKEWSNHHVPQGY